MNWICFGLSLLFLLPLGFFLLRFLPSNEKALLRWLKARNTRNLNDMISGLPSTKMREDFRGQDPKFATEMLATYYSLSEEERLDVQAFHDSEGPRKIHEIKLKHQDGTPTSADIKKWIEGK